MGKNGENLPFRSTGDEEFDKMVGLIFGENPACDGDHEGRCASLSDMLVSGMLAGSNEVLIDAVGAILMGGRRVVDDAKDMNMGTLGALIEGAHKLADIASHIRSTTMTMVALGVDSTTARKVMEGGGAAKLTLMDEGMLSSLFDGAAGDVDAELAGLLGKLGDDEDR